jgi:putative DNA primase/helicase
VEKSMTEESKVITREAPDDLMYSYAIKAINGANKFKYCIEEDKFYMYESGYWKYIHPLEILDLVNKTVRITQLSLSQKRNILEHMKQVAKMRLEKFNATPLFNLENYMVDPLGNNILGHKEEYYSTNRIPYVYRENATCELWIKTLNEIFEGDQDKLNILQEFFGNCLTRDTTLEKALLLIGESRSGKSTILNTLQYVIGVNNCSHVPLKYLSNPQYTGMMVNKLINIDGEVSKKAEDFEAEFKTIVTGHEVSCNSKYVAPFNFRPFCKLVMAANEFPKITDHSSAFYNRLILIPCDRVFGPKEQNINLREQLLEELPGIFNWACKGLQRLKQRGKFVQSNFMKQAIEELENENNPVNIFFNEYIEVAMGEELEKGYVYDKYKIWSTDTKNYVLSKARFGMALYKRFHTQTPKEAFSQSTNKRVWRNLRYVEFRPKEQPDLGWQSDTSPP